MLFEASRYLVFPIWEARYLWTWSQVQKVKKKERKRAGSYQTYSPFTNALLWRRVLFFHQTKVSQEVKLRTLIFTWFNFRGRLRTTNIRTHGIFAQEIFLTRKYSNSHMYNSCIVCHKNHKMYSGNSNQRYHCKWTCF